jgi:hypothetical protein
VIDFRYHLVSIIAVFLALAVGIVVGTAALNGPIQDGLRSNIDRLTDDKRALEGDVQELRGQVAAADDFATSLAPDLVGDVLEDQRVLLVTTAGTPGDLPERVRPLLDEAGASVTGLLELQPALAEPEQRQLLEDLVAQVVPAGIELPEGSPVERAGAELAAALTTGPDEDAVEPAEAQAVVAAFEEAELVDVSAEPGAEDTLTSATLVLVLAPTAPETSPGTAQQQQLEALLTVAAAFDQRSRGVVVAGPATSAAEGGLVRALREQSSISADLSSVDNADRGIGLVAAVLALAEQADGGVGQYGAGAGASAPLPPQATS